MRPVFIDLPLPDGRTLSIEPFGIAVMDYDSTNLEAFVVPFGHPDGYRVKLSREEVMKRVLEAHEKVGG